MTQDEDNENEFAAALAEFERQGKASSTGKGPASGERVTGRVVSITPKAVFVDLGAKSEGMIEVSEVSDAEGNLTVAIGDTLEAMISGTDPETGCLQLRRKVGRGPEARAELAKAHASNIPVEGTVARMIKGGAEIQVAGLRAFCPLSQLDIRYVEHPEQFVGQHLTFRITRYEEGGRGRPPNIVVSRRALLEEEAQVRATEILAKLEPGMVLKGRVTSIKDYGAFVDIGGLEGMVHASEMSHSRSARPRDVVAPGQDVEVQVLRIEKGEDPKSPPRIALSLRSLAPDPWDEVPQKYPDGTIVRGRVMRVEQYGAFVELTPGIEGLAHVSELAAGRRVQHAKDVVRTGQLLDVVVKGIDSEKRRISLGVAPDATAQDDPNFDYDAGGGMGTIGDVWKK